jgi:NAD(P)-dependent dehydrogenase (short-subunit alcohol dehydrogenase family)
VHGNAGQANYATAKAGVVGLTKGVAKEWGAFNIRANSLVFGHIATRLVQPKERGASIQASTPPTDAQPLTRRLQSEFAACRLHSTSKHVFLLLHGGFAR